MSIRSRILLTAATIMTTMASHVASAATPLPEILGTWVFEGIVLDEPRPQAALTVAIEFTTVGLSHLAYWREGQPGFCERRAVYSTDETGKRIEEWVVEMNPNSRADCANDPGMQAGAELSTPFTVNGDELRLLLNVRGKPTKAVWRRVSGSIEDLIGRSVRLN